MSDEGESGGRGVWVGLGLLALALIAVFAVVAAGPGGDGVTPEPEARPSTPRAEPLRAAPRSVRVPLPAPAGRSHPDARQRLAPVKLDGERKLQMNTAVDDVLQPARETCLQPWLDGLSAPRETEFVFDVVVHDGEIADIGLRSLDEPVPEDVVGCVADVVWSADWPTLEVPGELRLQRTLTLTPQAAP